MQDFFSDNITQPIEWFGSTHLFILLGFLLSLIFLWLFLPRLRNSKNEKYFRIFFIFLVFLFEWRVFESRILNGSLFRIPLCGIALYFLTYSIATKNKKIFKITYFYAFGTLLTFLFFDTTWGLDRWNGWTYFGAHALIGYLAIYGYRVFDFTPVKKDLYLSMLFLAIYAFISGFATYKYGGSDELFLLNPPVDFLNFLQEIHQVVYLGVLISLAGLLMFIMYLIIYTSEKVKLRLNSLKTNKNILKESTK